MASENIEVIAKIKPSNGQKFAIADAEDVEMPDGKRLPDVIPKLVPVTKGEYEELEAAGKIEPDVYYMIARDEA